MNTRMHPAQGAPRLTIGRVARAAGVGIDTIRYYEREGLLPEPERRLSGYRDYTPDAVTRLRFIRRAKELGFTLEGIRELKRVQRGLKSLIDACPGHGALESCPILTA